MTPTGVVATYDWKTEQDFQRAEAFLLGLLGPGGRSSTHPGEREFYVVRKFAVAVGAVNHGAQIVSIDWALSVILREPGQPEQQVGPCLMIGAYRRDQVPAEFIDVIDGLELAFQIPDNVWPPGAQRIVDVDKTKPFGFGLR